jgi:DEAD/DEAH box helicase domain-containing protein
MSAHLHCATLEKPLSSSDAWLWSHASFDREVNANSSTAWQESVQRLVDEGKIQESRGDEDASPQFIACSGSLSSACSPHRGTSIRSVEAKYEVREAKSDVSGPLSVIDEVDASKAFYSLFPGSVYRLRGEEYLITDLDLKQRRATARKCDVPLAYYTRAFDSTTIRILTQERVESHGRAQVGAGMVELRKSVRSYRKYWKAQDLPQESEIALDLPSFGYRSRGLWLELRPCSGHAIKDDAQAEFDWAGAHAAMHALMRVFPHFVISDRDDLDCACVDESGEPPMEQPRLLLFDAREGGLGHSDAAYPHALAMVREARCLVEKCPCANGCPSCIVDARCRQYNRLLSKSGAISWLAALEGFHA